MVLGMSLSTFTLIRVLISLVGIASGLVVVVGFLASKAARNASPCRSRRRNRGVCRCTRQVLGDARSDLRKPASPQRSAAELAQRLKLDVKALAAALQSGEFADRVQTDFSSGVRSGVNGTPTFFLNGQRHDSDFELERLGQAINEASSIHK